MEYLRGNATASAPGLFVICRHLVGEDGGSSEVELRDALQLLRSEDAQSETAAVLEASLKVGSAVGLLVEGKVGGAWSVDPHLASLMSIEEDSWPWFRGELLYRLSQHALQELAADGEIPDLVLALTWFLQCDPLSPLGWDWGGGPEVAVKQLGFGALANGEQWRAFRRWALALGLARQSRKVLIPEPSAAIEAQLPHLPSIGSAGTWLGALQERLPMLGLPNFLSRLPRGGREWSSVPASLVVGLRKLEVVGSLSLEAADDARDIVTVSLGQATRQVGRISVGGRS